MMKNKVLKLNRFLCAFVVCMALMVGGLAVIVSKPLTAKAEDEPVTHNLTIELNGGSRATAKNKFASSAGVIAGDVNFSEAAVINEVEEGVLTFDHATVRGLFDDIAPFAKIGGSNYLLPDGNWTEIKVPLLRGLFTSVSGNGFYNPENGDVMYLSGDSIEITGDTTLYCYYDYNDLVYATATANRNTDVSLAKGWRADSSPLKTERYYSARDLQPFFHTLVAIGSSNGGDGAFKSDSKPHGKSYTKGVEFPLTVTNLRGQVFSGCNALEYVTGLDNVVKFEVNSTFNEAFPDNMTPVLEFSSPIMSTSFVGTWSFEINSNNSRLIFNDYAGEKSPFDSATGDSYTAFTNRGSKTAPGQYVYVPSGKTAKWYPEGEESWRFMSRGSNKTNTNPYNIPMREYYQVTFNLDGGETGEKVNGKSLYAKQYQDAGAVSVKKIDETERNIGNGTDLTLNPAAVNLNLLSLTKPADPSHPTLAFSGWAYYDENEDKMIPFDERYWGTGDYSSIADLVDEDGVLELVAQYSTPVKVTYNPNNGNKATDIVSYEGAKLATPVNPSALYGHSFAGWFTDNGTFLNQWNFVNNTVGSTALTLYAKWTPVKYNIRYYVNGGTISLTDYPDVTAPVGANQYYGSSYTFNSSTGFTALAQPVKEGLVFAGWYANAELTGFEITEIVKETAGQVNLYAKWVTAAFKINYFLDGGVNASSNPDGYYEDSPTINLGAPTKEGYVFAGWYDNAEFTGDKITDIPKGSNGEINLYAKWTKAGKKGCGTIVSGRGAGFGLGAMILLPIFAAICVFALKRKSKIKAAQMISK